MDGENEEPGPGREQTAVVAKILKPLEHDVLSLQVLACLPREIHELILKEVLKPIQSQSFHAIDTILLRALILAQILVLEFFLTQFSANAFTKPFEFLIAQNLVHKHIMFIKDVFDRDLE